MKYYLGLDVGGTNLAAGVVDEEFRLLSKVSCPSGAGRQMEEIVADMAAVSQKAVRESGIPEKNISSWGIGMPSAINPATGLLVHANCFGWKNVAIYTSLKKYSRLQIYIENDANCAALGETLAGSGAGCKNVLMVTLGTGFGGGVIIDGKIYAGGDGMGAELGHTKLVYNGKRCTCGQRGCIEAYCSATALIRQAQESIKEHPEICSILREKNRKHAGGLEAKDVFEAAGEGDQLAAEVLRNYIEYLSCAIANFIVVFRPERVILGGGVANAGEELLVPLKKCLLANTFAGNEIGIPPITIAKCGNDAGIIGAAMQELYGANKTKKIRVC